MVHAARHPATDFRRSDGKLRPSHEPGGGLEQPVKPGRLGALYTRDVRNSSAMGSRLESQSVVEN